MPRLTFVTFPNSKLEDHINLLDHSAILRAIESGESFRMSHLDYPSMRRFKSEATAERISATGVRIRWSHEHEINVRNNIEEGKLVLSWDESSEVLLDEPDRIYWIGKSPDSEREYPTWKTLSIHV